jgi:hypothetical protein
MAACSVLTTDEHTQRSVIHPNQIARIRALTESLLQTTPTRSFEEDSAASASEVWHFLERQLQVASRGGSSPLSPTQVKSMVDACMDPQRSEWWSVSHWSDDILEPFGCGKQRPVRHSYRRRSRRESTPTDRFDRGDEEVGQDSFEAHHSHPNIIEYILKNHNDLIVEEQWLSCERWNQAKK